MPWLTQKLYGEPSEQTAPRPGVMRVQFPWAWLCPAIWLTSATAIPNTSSLIILRAMTLNMAQLLGKSGQPTGGVDRRICRIARTGEQGEW